MKVYRVRILFPKTQNIESTLLELDKAVAALPRDRTSDAKTAEELEKIKLEERLAAHSRIGQLKRPLDNLAQAIESEVAKLNTSKQ